MWRVSITLLSVLCCLCLYVSLFACFFSFAEIFLLLICMFPRYIFRWWILSLYHFMMTHSYLPLFVKQFALLLYYFSFVSVVAIYFSYRGCNHYSFYYISCLSSTVYPSLLPLLYSLMRSKLYSYTLLLHGKMFFFVFYFLLYLNSHLSS